MRYLTTLLRRSRRLFFVLVKVLLPVMIAVQLSQRMGWVDAIANAIAPAIGWLGLPPEAGIIWVTSVFVGVYGAIGALVGFAPTLEISTGQFSALAAMVLFAHALPVEQAIVRQAGASFWATAGLRVGAALLYGAAITWVCRVTGVLAEPLSLDWLTSAGGQPDAGFLEWLASTALSLGLTFFIIAFLLVLLDFLEWVGATRRITAVMAPVLRVSGLPPEAAPVTTVGVLLGLTYGGALIIEEAQRRAFSKRTRFLALAWLSLSHALIEDTLLLLALGANVWIILVGRLLLTMAIVAVLAALLRNHDGDPGSLARPDDDTGSLSGAGARRS